MKNGGGGDPELVGRWRCWHDPWYGPELRPIPEVPRVVVLRPHASLANSGLGAYAERRRAVMARIYDDNAR